MSNLNYFLLAHRALLQQSQQTMHTFILYLEMRKKSGSHPFHHPSCVCFAVTTESRERDAKRAAAGTQQRQEERVSLSMQPTRTSSLPLHLTGCINNAISVECITASCLRLHFLSGAGLKGLLMETRRWRWNGARRRAIWGTKRVERYMYASLKLSLCSLRNRLYDRNWFQRVLFILSFAMVLGLRHY